MDAPVALNLRGASFSIHKEDLMALPESILLCLFPNGLVLNQAPQQTHLAQQPSEGADVALAGDADVQHDDNTYYVDFDGPCLEFILSFFDRAKIDYYGTPEQPKRPYHPDPNAQTSATSPGLVGPEFSNPLFHKQAIIVLREELEYFVIPHRRPVLGDATNLAQPSTSATPISPAEHPGTDSDGFPNNALVDLKKSVGLYLLKQHRSVFAALQRNVNREKNAAEQHLIEMLCMSGFGKDDDWGYRAVEPSRCCITSIALVLLKTGIEHLPDTTDGAAVTPQAPAINAAQLATAQKLLLFWRKPARKCWWDASEVEGMDSPEGKPLKVWARRIWTLETVRPSCFHLLSPQTYIRFRLYQVLV